VFTSRSRFGHERDGVTFTLRAQADVRTASPGSVRAIAGVRRNPG